MATVLDSDIFVSEFELQSSYYAQFQTNTLEKGINPPYTSSCGGLDSIIVVLLQGCPGYLITYEGWYAFKQRNQNRTR